MVYAAVAGVGMLLTLAATPLFAQQQGPSANEPSKTLDKGTKIEGKTQGNISSKTNKIGDMVPVVVVEDVKNGTGAIVVPAGSPAVIEITDILPPDKNHPEGVLQVAVKSVDVNGQTYRVKEGKGTGKEGKKPGWSLFKKDNKEKTRDTTAMPVAPIVGIVADPKGQVVGTDIVMPPGSEVTFTVGEDAITLVAG